MLDVGDDANHGHPRVVAAKADAAADAVRPFAPERAHERVVDDDHARSVLAAIRVVEEAAAFQPQADGAEVATRRGARAGRWR